MNQNIDLGSFQWDTSKLSSDIAANLVEIKKLSQEIKKNKEEVKKASDAIDTIQKKIESETKAQGRLTKQLDKGYISQEKYNAEIEKSNQVIEEMVEEKMRLAKVQSDRIVEVNKLEQATKSLRAENAELNKIMSASANIEKLNIENYTTENKSINQLRKEKSDLLKLRNAENGATEESRKKLEELNKAIEQNTQAQKEKVSENEKRFFQIGQYKEAISSAFSEISQGASKLLSGDVQGGFEAVKNGFKGILQSAKSLVVYLAANPLTALFVVIAAAATGIALGVREMFKYNEEVAKDIKFLQDKFGDLGKDADTLRLKIKGVSETYGIEFKRITDTVDSLSSAGLTDELGALEAIKKGLATAPDTSEFLSKLDMAASKAQQTGINIEQVLNLTKALQGTAINPDTIYGELEKATNALYKPLSENVALVNTFGKDFAQKLLKDVKDGSINTVDALERVNKKGKELNINTEKQAALGKDLFGKMGANAGAYAENMRLVSEAQKDQFSNLTDLQKAVTKLEDANEELAIAKDKALQSDAIILFQKNIELLWVKLKTVWYNIVEAFTDIVKWLDKVTGQSELVSEAWDAFVEYAKTLRKAIGTLVGVFTDLFDALGLSNSETNSYIKTIFKTLSPLALLKKGIQLATGAIKIFSSLIDSSRVHITAFAITTKSIFSQLISAARSFMNLDFKEGLEKLKNINISKEFANARKEAEKIVALNKSKKNDSEEDKTSKKTKPKVNGNYQDKTADELKAAEAARKKAEAEAKKLENKRIADAKKEMEQEAKRQLDIARETANQKAELAKTELAEYISLNAEKLMSDKSLSKNKLEEQIAYYDEVKRMQSLLNEEERKAKEVALQQKIDEINKKKELGKQLNENDKNEIENLKSQITILNREFANKEIDLTRETQKKKTEISTDYDKKVFEQRNLAQAIEFQQRLLKLEEQGANEFAIRGVQLEQETQQKLDNFFKENELLQQLDEDNYISKQEIENVRKELEAEIKATDDLNEQQRKQNQLDTLNLIEQEASMKSIAIEDAVNANKIAGRAMVLQGISQIFGQETKLGKAVAIAGILYEKYQAISGVISKTAIANASAVAQSPMTGGMPWVGINSVQAAISIGGLIGSAASSIGQITGIKEISSAGAGISNISSGVKQAKGYYDGGYTGDGGKYEPAGVVHKGEVVWSQQDVKAIGGASIANALRPTAKKGYYNGGVVGGANLATVQKSLIQTVDYTEMANVIGEKVLEGSARGSSAGSREGIENLTIKNQFGNQSII